MYGMRPVLQLRLLLLLILATLQISAVPITYTLTGYVQASAGGTSFDTSFIWTVFADTAGITNPSPGHFQNRGTSGFIVAKGVGSGVPIGVTVYLDITTGQVTFGNTATGGAGLTSTQLKTWDLVSPLGPINGPNVLIPGTLTLIDGTVVSLTGVSNSSNGPSPTFQAQLGIRPVIASVVPNGDDSGQVVDVLAPAQYATLVGGPFGSTAPVVTVNGKACTIILATDASVDFQVPADASIGNASVVITTSAGSSTPYSITINPANPIVFFLHNVQGPTPFTLFRFFPQGDAIPTPSPGDRVFITVDGLGSTSPPRPEVQVDGKDISVFGVFVQNGLGFDGPGTPRTPVPGVVIQIPQVNGGPHTLTVIAGGVTSPPRQFTVIATGLILSQTGLTFTAVQGGATLPAQTFSILSGLGSLGFSLKTSTVTGGAWLQATPTTGSAVFGSVGTAIQVKTDATGLAAGTYYGQITVTSPDVTNSPQAVTVVLNVVPAGTKLSPSLDKTGLIFVGAPGGKDPTAQTINVFNPLSSSLSFTSTIQVAGTNPFKTDAAAGTITSGQSFAIHIQATLTGQSAGTKTATLTLTFSDGSVRNIALLLVVAPGAGSSTSAFQAASPLCTPTKLLPVFTLVGDNFNVAAAWPTPVETSIVDDCGNSLLNGSVVLTFSNGDAPLRMTSNLNGVWSVTWPPSNPRPSGIVLTLAAQQQQAPMISGSAQIKGGVTANPQVPQVGAGGVVETAAYGSPVAPGDIIAIFGQNLASDSTGAASLPLPSQLLSTTAVLGGIQLPLFYASNGQINAMVPYDLPLNTRQQIVVQRGSSYSVPQSVVIGVAQPAVFTIDSSGQGQGVIFKYDSAGNAILADKNAPAKAGDVLVIYCAGLGAVTPPVAAGAPTPLTGLTQTVNTVTVFIGGASAPVQFAGLTPGSAGLYQVNVIVPPGLSANDTTSLRLSIAGQDSGVVTLAIGK
jgi:uncharacterized protein (TIGR03437 family)